MKQVTRPFQVFTKPTGAVCNLGCRYCYYLKKENIYPQAETFRMPDDLLEDYIIQHIRASAEPVIRFSWHGGEPTVLGLDYFRNIVTLQQKHKSPNQSINNSIQTNGVLLDDDWCRFFAAEGFNVGLSLDGPREMHDRFRVTKRGRPTHKLVLRGYHLLRRHKVPCDILCVVNAYNVQYPIQVYRYFKQIKVRYLGLLPLVEPQPDAENHVSDRTAPAPALGRFLCAIFDEWKAHDIGRITVQLFEEVARTALGQEHSLCIFRKTCGDFPVIEHNGDFFSCDHFVDHDHRLGNIRETPLADLIESPSQRAFGQSKWEKLPRTCLECEVLTMCHGGCPKDRFIHAPNGKEKLNYLCEGYKQFFTHCLPFVKGLAFVQKRRQTPAPVTRSISAPLVKKENKIGRNDPCPCGSGLKYKKCCLSK